MAQRVAARFGIPAIDQATLGQWRAEAPARSLYVFDVRTPEEYAAGHIAGTKHVAGGQLVQETDRHMPTWGARVVLVDDDGVRAIMTAHWLRQMGWDAAALTVDMAAEISETGPYVPRTLGFGELMVSAVDVTTLNMRLAAGRAIVIDLDWSRAYRAGHIPGAYYAIRSRLAQVLSSLPPVEWVVTTSSDGLLGMFGAAERNGRAAMPVFALMGGTAAWVEAGPAAGAGGDAYGLPAG
jgi:rhodanese-related sulfurtransferase